MAPHAVLSLTPDAQVDIGRLLLDKFDVTTNGFLPAKLPLSVLPDAYYSSWENTIQSLPELLKFGTFRKTVEGLNVLSTDKLGSEAEWRRAYVILAFFTHAYIWGEERAAEKLPPSISIPFLEVSKHLDLPPVLTYSSTCLWNFASASSDFSDLSSIAPLHTLTGTTDEKWFFMISVAMEAQTAPVIPVMMRALEAIKTRNYEVLTGALEELEICIGKVGDVLERMYENCDPDVFYHKIRPFLAGSKNMEAAGLPRGVFYPDRDGSTGSWKQLRGGSNGQSSTLQFFDIVLGVHHSSEGSINPHHAAAEKISKGSPVLSFQEEVREYMPAPHREFLVHVSRMGSIRELALVPPTTPEQEGFCAAYTRAAEALATFRTRHIGIVTRYIILPSQRAAASGVAPGKQDLASASAIVHQISKQNGCAPVAELKGTGGTSLIPFLTKGRDETLAASVLTRPVA